MTARSRLHTGESVGHDAAGRIGFPLTERLERFLAETDLPTPFLVVDLDVVAERYRQLAGALPFAELFYAVKANPAAPILRLVDALGGSFDVASPAEIELCLAEGIDPSRISYGNTIKKERHIAWAYEQGVRVFAIDSDAELDKVIRSAPGSLVCCRLLCNENPGADWPLSRKFGCEPSLAVEVLARAAGAGLSVGVSFHVGSQQRDPDAWGPALAEVAKVRAELRRRGVELDVVNLGGGFPAHYDSTIAPIGAYGASITAALRRRLGEPDRGELRIMAEPGRYLVADAGVMRSEVVLVARKSELEERRWVYLDVGMFGGLAETMDEAIRYRVRTSRDGDPTGPVCIAGPTCDSADILYQKTDYRLPLSLAPGDWFELMSTGAYTTTYSSVGFNGFSPLASHYLPARAEAAAAEDRAA
ncbi:MAG: type III PLP-dependent enzyme [Acidimicrobiales bacterium]